MDNAAPTNAEKAAVRRRNEQVGVVVKPGRILYEMEGVPEKDAREALRLAAHKLSIKTKFVKRLESEIAI